MSKQKTQTPYQRIMKAYYKGTECRLSYLEVSLLARDHAISCRAEQDDSGIEEMSSLQAEHAYWENVTTQTKG